MANVVLARKRPKASQKWKALGTAQKRNEVNRMSEKASSPMLVTLLPIVTEVREEQDRKAQFPMLVTLLGIVTEVKEEQS